MALSIAWREYWSTPGELVVQDGSTPHRLQERPLSIGVASVPVTLTELALPLNVTVTGPLVHWPLGKPIMFSCDAGLLPPLQLPKVTLLVLKVIETISGVVVAVGVEVVVRVSAAVPVSVAVAVQVMVGLGVPSGVTVAVEVCVAVGVSVAVGVAVDAQPLIVGV